MAPEPLRPLGAVPAADRVGPASAPSRRGAVPAGGFDRVLAERLRTPPAEALRWSAHARDRLAQRGLQVTPEVADRLEDAVRRAAAKGSRDSLVLVDDMAFVVSVANRVVVTAVDREGLKDQVFTNIDSAVLAR